jgi:hypothetical protein
MMTQLNWGGCWCLNHTGCGVTEGVQYEGDGYECKKWDVLAGSQQQAAKDQSPAKHYISFTQKIHTQKVARWDYR